MERGRTQVVSSPVVEDPGEEPDEGDGDRRLYNNATNSASNNLNNNNNNNPPLPPSYPCNEVCAHCGKKLVDTLINDEVQQESTETLVDCTCECHRQVQTQEPQKVATAQTHIPPGGPNCLPGCGYSGLPCYNCSSFQNHLQSQEQTAQHIGQSFPTQIYTVELLNPASPSVFQSQGQQSSREHEIIMAHSEDSPESRKRKRTCISLVVFIITINVAIAIFRMLSGSSIYYG